MYSYSVHIKYDNKNTLINNQRICIVRFEEKEDEHGVKCITKSKKEYYYDECLIVQEVD